MQKRTREQVYEELQQKLDQAVKDLVEIAQQEMIKDLERSIDEKLKQFPSESDS